MSAINDRNNFGTRLKFNNTGRNRVGILDLQDQSTRDILGKGITRYTKAEVIEKLMDYQIVDKTALLMQRWIRYINTDDGKLRGGGFLIKDETDFAVLKNISKNFTFSVKKRGTIFFMKKPKSNIQGIPEGLVQLLFKYKPKNGSQYVLVKDDGSELFSGRTTKVLHQNTPNSSFNGIRKAFGKDKDKYKKMFLFRLDPADIRDFRTELNSLGDEQKEDDTREPSETIDPQVLEVIERYY